MQSNLRTPQAISEVRMRLTNTQYMLLSRMEANGGFLLLTALSLREKLVMKRMASLGLVEPVTLKPEQLPKDSDHSRGRQKAQQERHKVAKPELKPAMTFVLAALLGFFLRILLEILFIVLTEAK